MKVRFRDIINPLILNDKSFVGFQGDSEFVDENGELQFGVWTFKDAIKMGEPDVDDKTLDSEVNEALLFGGFNPFEIYNDKGYLCIVEIQYKRHENLNLVRDAIAIDGTTDDLGMKISFMRRYGNGRRQD